MTSITSLAKITLGMGKETGHVMHLGALMLALCVLPMASAFGQNIEITSIDDLDKIGTDPAYPLDGDYVLTDDIDASATAGWNSGEGFDPIGTYDVAHPEQAFTGTFDGQDHVITGLTINRPDEDYVGLFAALGSGGVVQNLGLEAVAITGGESVGALIAGNDGTILNCHARGAVTGAIGVGGLVGSNLSGAVSHCYATGTVTGTGNFVGGLIGDNYAGTVSKSYATGAVRGTGNYIGGLVGGNHEGAVSQCYATGSVTGYDYVGGLVGSNPYGTVSRCYATGAPRGPGNYIGGLVGSNSDLIEASFWDTETSGASDSDGGTGVTTIEMYTESTFTSAGWDFESEPEPVWYMLVEGSYPYLEALPRTIVPDVTTDTSEAEAIAALDAVGLLARLTYEYSDTVPEDYVIEQAPQTGSSINASTTVDLVISLGSPVPISSIEELQLIGNDPDYPLDRTYILTQDIDASATADWNDGAGFAPIGEYDAAYPELTFTGTLDGQEHVITGLTINRPDEDYTGLFGALGSRGAIENVGFEDSVVIGRDFVGGVVGYNTGGLLSKCYTVGSTTGEDYVGGLAGRSDGAISQCGATGGVAGQGKVGGLAGLNFGGTVSESYATATVSGHAHVGGLVGLNTSGTLSQCYAMRTVTGTGNYTGGLVALNSSGTISECYATPAVTGMGNVDLVGGLVGYNLDGTVESSFWDTETSGISDSGNPMGLTTVEMQTLSTFIDAGWDFGAVWEMVSGESYPYLREAFQVELPDVSGLPWDEGVAEIEAAGLVPLVTFEHDDTVPRGDVISQAPAPGGISSVNMGTPVSLVVSLGGPIHLFNISEVQLIGNAPLYPLFADYVLEQDINASATASWNDGAGFVPIGVYDAEHPEEAFTGTFDGQGYVITGLAIDRPDEDYVGLFGAVGAGGVVQNVDFEEGAVSGGSRVGSLVGYNNGGTISDCLVSGSVTGAGSYVGGLIGYNHEGTVSRCHTTGAVSGSGGHVGGLVGSSPFSTVSECSASGPVMGAYSVGGLVGSMHISSKTLECFAAGDVVGQYYIGGLVGRNINGRVSQSYATGSVTGEHDIGGLAGVNDGGIISECYSMGLVTGTEAVGGLVGFSTSGRVVASFWDIDTSGQAGSGGGRGLTTAAMTLPSVYANAGWDTTTWVMAEGEYPRLVWEDTGADPLPAPDPVPLVGSGTEADPYLVQTPEDFAELSWFAAFLDAHIQVSDDLDCSGVALYPIGDLGAFTGVFDGQNYLISNVTIDEPGIGAVGVFASLGEGGEIRNVDLEDVYVRGAYSVGGLVGVNAGGTISNCSVTGAIEGELYQVGVVNSAGGLVGRQLDGAISGCYTTCTVTGDDVGGLVGYHVDGAVSECYATGAATGEDSAGGLVGYQDGGMISQCYARGAIAGVDTAGGLVGFQGDGEIAECYATGLVTDAENVGGLVGNAEAGTVDSSFWDTETSGAAVSVGGTGLPTEEMQIQTTFTDAGWDFITPVWYVLAGGSYPYLSALPQSVVPDVTTDTLENAIEALEAVDLAADVTYVYSSDIPLGQVISQNPAGSSSINRGTALSLVVSQGIPDIDVTTIDELQLIGNDPDYPLFGRYFLTQDIDASATATWNDGAGFLPVGSKSAPFTGTLDGQGFVIAGLTINRPEKDDIGLIGVVGADGLVQNVVLEGGTVIGRDYVGALAGGNEGGTILQCGAMATVQGENEVGALLGTNNAGTVSECYATSEVTGWVDYTGGLVGWNAGTISDSYAMSPVEGVYGVGGLVGWNVGTISRCYSTGALTGAVDFVGGLVGKNDGGTVDASFWDTETSGMSESDGGEGLTTAEMQTDTTFTDAGWDFDAVWGILGSYPYLQSPPVCTLTYTATAGGSIVGVANQVINMGTTGSPVSVDVETGYSFGQWSDGATTESRMDTNVTTNLSVTAEFIPDTYTVTFDAGEGTAPSPPTRTVTFDAPYGELASTTRTGYTFDGWFTAETGGTKVTPSTIMTTPADHTLYAQWTVNSYTVSFDAQGGAAPTPSEITVTFDEEYGELASTTFPGYNFVGWFTAETGGTKVTPSTIMTTPADHTLYAQWTVNSYTVSFDAQGGSAPTIGSKSVIFNTAYGELASTTREGYTFEGWFTAESGGTEVTSSTTMTTPADHTLYAHWTGNDYTVTFDAQGGTIPTPSSITVTCGDPYGALADTTREGYTFEGWFTEETGGTEVTPSTDVTATTDHTLYAHWTSKTYTLTYSAGSHGTVEGELEQTVEHGAAGTSVEAFADDGYHFEQWSDGSTENPRVDTNVTEDISVTAEFAINEYVLSYTAGANGTIDGEAEQIIEHGSNGAPVEAVPNDGYLFEEWSDGSTENPRTDRNITEDMSVTASFVLETGGLQVFITPQAAVDDGAMWRRVASVEAKSDSEAVTGNVFRFGDPVLNGGVLEVPVLLFRGDDVASRDVFDADGRFVNGPAPAVFGFDVVYDPSVLALRSQTEGQPDVRPSDTLQTWYGHEVTVAEPDGPNSGRLQIVFAEPLMNRHVTTADNVREGGNPEERRNPFLLATMYFECLDVETSTPLGIENIVATDGERILEAVDAQPTVMKVDNGSDWLASGAIESDLPPGTYTVEFKEILGWSAPEPLDVEVPGSETAEATVTYADICGSLQVTIEPEGAVDAGAQWRRVGTETWLDSGFTEERVPQGEYEIEFKNVTDWNTPENQTVTIETGETTEIVGEYTVFIYTGSLKVVIGPEEARDAGAQWRRTGTSEWHDSEFKESDVPEGVYTVEFKSISEWDEPDKLDVEVRRNETARATVAYTPDTGLGGCPLFNNKALQPFAEVSVYEPVLPSPVNESDMHLCAPLAPLAIRLRSDEPIDPDTVWGVVSWTEAASEEILWLPLDDTDGWVVYAPQTPWAEGEVVTFTAGAYTVTGHEVGPFTYEFVASEEVYEGTVAVVESYSTTDRPEFVGRAYEIYPGTVYFEPLTVQLPVPEGVDAEALEPAYLFTEDGDSRWVDGNHVEGWLEPGSLHVVHDADGTFIEFQVNHGGTVQLRRRVVHVSSAGVHTETVSTDLLLFLGLGAFLLLQKRWWARRA